VPDNVQDILVVSDWERQRHLEELAGITGAAAGRKE
jgi:hypothetical protein